MSGVLSTMWCAMQPWTKMETVAAKATPVAMAASAVGIALFRRQTDTVFRRLLITLLFASGLLILVRELRVMTVSL